jgi:hypothetical protein
MSRGTRPEPPREAALIEAARRRLKLSIRKAAPQAGISDARWRQITSGYQSVSGEHVPVRAPADTLARMAQVVGVTGDELRRIGRQDAAEALAEITPTVEEQSAAAYAPPVDAVYAIMAALPPDAQEEVIRRLGMRPAVQEPPNHHRRAS